MKVESRMKARNVGHIALLYFLEPIRSVGFFLPLYSRLLFAIEFRFFSRPISYRRSLHAEISIASSECT